MKKPIVTIALLAANLAVFLGFVLYEKYVGAVDYAVYGGLYPPAVEAGQWYRFLTFLFLHGSTRHLLNNTIMIFGVGTYVEDALGHLRFLILYLSSGILGGIFSFFMYRGTNTVCIGASGAAFGLVGCLLSILLKHRGRYRQLSLKGMLILLALTVYYGISSVGIDNYGHLGGAVSGFLLGLLLYRKPKYQDHYTEG
ncbi:MAG: rhomboid family intramembrane serine protease [Lachnospiraceae bacterium]|nr:rhomboid family intramembrane serine protease [Lachnospiraceae bacterium]